jgi:hypothetical protein
MGERWARALLALFLSCHSCGSCAGWQMARWPTPHAAGQMSAPRRTPLPPSLIAAADLGVELGSPQGPDPYRLVQDELDFIKRSLKKLLTTQGGESGVADNGVLTMAAREFMSRKGKSFRPMLVLLIGRATDPDFATGARHSKLAVISEMIHTASLIHADVLESHMTDTSQGTLVHQEVTLEVGNKVCILAGDFLLAKSAVELSLLEDNDVTEIVARGLESICEGGMRAYNSTAEPAALEALTADEHLETVCSTHRPRTGHATPRDATRRRATPRDASLTWHLAPTQTVSRYASSGRRIHRVAHCQRLPKLGHPIGPRSRLDHRAGEPPIW